MRTTLNISEPLLDEAKARAAELGQSVSTFVEEAIRFALEHRKSAPAEPFEVITYGQGGVRPGVDLDRTSSLLAAEDVDLYSPGKR